jgi:glycosyltransferase 2 family protein
VNHTPNPPGQARRTSSAQGEASRAAALIRIGISLTLLVWLLSRADLSSVAEVLVNADLRLLAVAFGLNLMGWTLSVSRWRLLLRARGVVVSFGTTLRSYLTGIFFNNLLPSTVGGDSVRIYDSWRWGAGKAGAVAVIGVDRLTGLLALLSLAVVAVVLAPHLLSGIPLLRLWILLGALGLVTLAGIALIPDARARAWIRPLLEWAPAFVRRMAEKVSGSLRAFRDQPRVVRRSLAISLVLQVTVVLHAFVLTRALGLQVPLMALFFIMPVALVIMSVPFSVNAIGIREGVFAFFLGLFGVSLSGALAFSWLAFGFILLQGAIGGLVYASGRRGRGREADEMETPALQEALQE